MSSLDVVIGRPLWRGVNSLDLLRTVVFGSVLKCAGFWVVRMTLRTGRVILVVVFSILSV